MVLSQIAAACGLQVEAFWLFDDYERATTSPPMAVATAAQLRKLEGRGFVAQRWPAKQKTVWSWVCLGREDSLCLSSLLSPHLYQRRVLELDHRVVQY